MRAGVAAENPHGGPCVHFTAMRERTRIRSAGRDRRQQSCLVRRHDSWNGPVAAHAFGRMGVALPARRRERHFPIDRQGTAGLIRTHVRDSRDRSRGRGRACVRLIRVRTVRDRRAHRALRRSARAAHAARAAAFPARGASTAASSSPTASASRARSSCIGSASRNSISISSPSTPGGCFPRPTSCGRIPSGAMAAASAPSIRSGRRSKTWSRATASTASTCRRRRAKPAARCARFVRSTGRLPVPRPGSPARAAIKRTCAARPGLIGFEKSRGLIKFNPLFDWTRERVLAVVAEHRVPINPLHAKGFASIGCAPCTRALEPGEPERNGRWWWEQDSHRECGLHLPRQPYSNI